MTAPMRGARVPEALESAALARYPALAGQTSVLLRTGLAALAGYEVTPALIKSLTVPVDGYTMPELPPPNSI